MTGASGSERSVGRRTHQPHSEAHHVHVLTCPDCAATNVDVVANRWGAGTPRWHGLCLDCGSAWDFDDD